MASPKKARKTKAAKPTAKTKNAWIVFNADNVVLRTDSAAPTVTGDHIVLSNDSLCEPGLEIARVPADALPLDWKPCAYQWTGDAVRKIPMRSKTKAKVKTKVKIKAKAKTAPKAKAKSKTKTKVKAKAKTTAKPKTKPQPKPKAKSKIKAKAKVKRKTKSKR